MFSSPTNSEPSKNPRCLPRHFDCEDFALQWEAVIESVAEQAPLGSESRDCEARKPKLKERDGLEVNFRLNATSDRLWERQLLWVLWVFAGSVIALVLAKSFGVELVANGVGPLMIAICSMQMGLMGRVLGGLRCWHLPMMGLAWVAMKLNAESLTSLGCLHMAQAEQYLMLLLGSVSLVARLSGGMTFVEGFSSLEQARGEQAQVEQARTGARFQFSIGEILAVTMYLAMWIPLREASDGFSSTSLLHHPMLPLLASLGIQLLLVGGWLMESRSPWAVSGRLACLLIPLVGLGMNQVSQVNLQDTMVQATWVTLGGLAYYGMQWAVTHEPSPECKMDTVRGSFAN